MRVLVFIVCVCTLSFASPHPKKQSPLKRAKELKQFLQKEQAQFEKRKTKGRAISEELDAINAEQNRVRQRIADIKLGHTELEMAAENLRTEFEKQKELERQEKQRLKALLKGLYRIRRDGLWRFVMRGKDFASVTNRARLLFHMLRTNSKLTKKLAERAQKLIESEEQVAVARADAEQLLSQLSRQQKTLYRLLSKKRGLLRKIEQKQRLFLASKKEHEGITKKVSKIFDNFEAKREAITARSPRIQKITLPVAGGRVIKQFGRSVHDKFKTITYHKGLEIEAKQESPVYAVLPGTVEYKGWVKGLGNVLILHHGDGVYSLNAHLFKSLLEQGQKVQQGDTIALVGDTGRTEKPSLYFELRRNGKAVDPIPHFTSDALKHLS